MVAGMSRASSVRTAPERPARISVGIGSWADAEYTGILYPPRLAASEKLKTYATWFRHVEVNASYYRTPSRATLEEWVKQTPADFMFDVKLHRAFSDSPDKTALKGDFVSWWLQNTAPLIEADRLGAFLLVMPPSFAPGRRRLEELEVLVEKFAPHRIAVELRHRGWVDGDERERTLAFFRAHRLVWVAVDMPRVEGSALMPPVDEVTHEELGYLRLHGRNVEWSKLKTAEARHTYRYAASELEEIAQRVRALARNARTVHVVANNHAQDFAPRAALELQQLLGPGVAPGGARPTHSRE